MAGNPYLIWQANASTLLRFQGLSFRRADSSLIARADESTSRMRAGRSSMTRLRKKTNFGVALHPAVAAAQRLISIGSVKQKGAKTMRRIGYISPKSQSCTLRLTIEKLRQNGLGSVPVIWASFSGKSIGEKPLGGMVSAYGPRALRIAERKRRYFWIQPCCSKRILS